MEVSEHALKRYVERIVGKTSTFEINLAIEKNKDMLVEQINKMYDNSREVFSGNIGDAKTYASFCIRDDIALVVDKKKGKIITLYRISFNFPSEIIPTIINSLLNEINLIDEQIIKVDDDNKEKIIDIEMEVEERNIRIASLLQEVDILKQKNKSSIDKKDILAKELSLLYTKQKEYVYQLFAMTDYKKDLKDLNL